MAGRVVYSSYHDDQIELRLLDLASGRSRSLLADGAVNVEPRWSPDGHRIAFVSTAYEGRWHIFIAPVSPDGTLGPALRITEDHESGLPRYYYGTHDQYISPTWSPDGQELIFISNRGHIWGSGGFWRMPARPNGDARELRYEETTWKARPDWSRDGKRVVYSSYLGRQWHQLWLMTADGGDPFQLTYGEGDATAPRWSPDGRRIAYITNERGNTGLSLVDVPGGKIERVAMDRRIYLEPVGRLQLVVTDRRRPADSCPGLDHRSRTAEAMLPTMPGATRMTATTAPPAGSSTGTSMYPAPRRSPFQPAGSVWRSPTAPSIAWSAGR